MPLKQVYGKRSRAIGDPFAAFVSPQRKAVNQEVHVAQVAEEFSRIQIHDAESNTRDMEPKRGHRRALSERSANSVKRPVVMPDLPKGRPRARGRVVDDEDDEDLRGVLMAQIDGSETKGIDETSAASFEPDDVPLFCEDHGYELEDCDNPLPTYAAKPQKPSDLESLSLDNSTVSEAPSISIVPPTPPPVDEYREHCAQLLTLSLHSMTDFADWSAQLSNHFHITKIAEASFGEVYRLSLLREISGLSANDESVFKIIPLRPPKPVLPIDKRKRQAALKKADAMSKPDDVANEVRLLQRMSSIPGFTNFRDVRVVQGRPAEPFVQAFSDFNKTQQANKKELSHFPDPSKKSSYEDDQLWAVIEMQDAGQDLERFVETWQCTSIWAAWDVFWSVVLSLAKGEEAAEFEHRDLHLGNICVRRAGTSSRAIDVTRNLRFTSLETTIIDYTISRAVMPDTSIAYHDLSQDPGLFEGDSITEYQYDIYRYMRGAALVDDAYAELSAIPSPATSGRTWRDYHPITNLIWLHLVLYKLLEQVSWPSATKAPPKKQKAQHAQWKRANDLERVLLRVQELLDPGVLCESEMKSSSDLVGLALGEGWLGVGDIVGGDGVEMEEESELVAQLEELDLDGVLGIKGIEVTPGPWEAPVARSGRTRRKQ